MDKVNTRYGEIAVKLARLQLPGALSSTDAKEFAKHLRVTLKREARHADFGWTRDPERRR